MDSSRNLNPYDRSVRSLNDADNYEFSGESEYSRDKSDPYQMVDYMIDRGINFRGRGPKGFVLSDEQIREEVCEFLTRDPLVDASQIDVDVRAGSVFLTGQVDSRRTKRLAELSVEDLPGVSEVVNQLRISTGTKNAE
ncbi:MAG: BON domain-containing protein [Bdellovibrionales bacterium]|nr:BON domain-containing protein [Bdellovibrionales bacterium]